MDILQNLAFGFAHALTWQNLMFCAVGCVVGTLVGLLPGLGPLATISLLLPLTYSIPIGGALIMKASARALLAPYPTSAHEQIAIAAIRIHACAGIRFHHAACA